MLRIVVMGIVVPVITLASAAAWAGVATTPIVNVPEPASLLLLATGIGGIAAVKRLRRRS